MNKYQVSGAVKSALGRVQEHAGKTMGSTGQQAKGILRQSEGRLQTACGKMKEVLRNSGHD
jgi:uncharacterized protein YjbJ (UPF0337 family)